MRAYYRSHVREGTRHWIGDVVWTAIIFVVVTALVYFLRQQGVDVPTLPDWLVGV